MEWNRKDCGEFIKSRKCCLRNHKSNAGYDLWKHLQQTRNSFKGSRQERLVLCLSTSSDLSSWRVPLSDPKCCWMESDLIHYVHRMALLKCSKAGPVFCGSNQEQTSSQHYHDICKLRWRFSNCEFWYAAYCFTYSKLLFQTLPGANTPK